VQGGASASLRTSDVAVDSGGDVVVVVVVVVVVSYGMAGLILGSVVDSTGDSDTLCGTCFWHLLLLGPLVGGDVPPLPELIALVGAVHILGDVHTQHIYINNITIYCDAL
jgi:hypothetical protein